MTNRNATASADGWYFHVQGFNQYDQPNGTLDLGPYLSDNTAPDAPVVIDDGATSGSLTSLHATWSAVDDQSGIGRYEYAVGTTAGATDVLDWTAASPETATEVTQPGLSLVDGQTYYISVKARNNAQLWSSVGTSDGIIVQAPETSILGGKALPDGSSVKITLRTVTAVYGGAFYIEEADRYAGIKVLSAASVTRGQVVDVIGTVQTADGERYIAATAVTVH